jgi:hypothetical protein
MLFTVFLCFHLKLKQPSNFSSATCFCLVHVLFTVSLCFHLELKEPNNFSSATSFCLVLAVTVFVSRNLKLDRTLNAILTIFMGHKFTVFQHTKFDPNQCVTDFGVSRLQCFSPRNDLITS